MTSAQQEILVQPRVPDLESVHKVGSKLAAALYAILNTAVVWQERASQRVHLAALEDRLLKDTGLSHADVAAETAKPFWRA